MSNGPFLESIVLGGEKLTIRDPNASHDISVTDIVNMLYPVGSVIIRYDTLDPGDYLNVGTWSLIQAGKYLLTTNGEAGETGGDNSVSLEVKNIPAHSHTLQANGTHTHTVTINNAGSHTHTGSVAQAGAHQHTASTSEGGTHNHNMKGWDSRATDGTTGFRPGATGGDLSTKIIQDGGAHTHDVTVDSAGAHTHTLTVNSAGTHTHTGSNSNAGSHTHTVNKTGEGEAFTIEPEYIAVRVWRRTE